MATDYAANPRARASVIGDYCARDAAFLARSNMRERKAKCALSIRFWMTAIGAANLDIWKEPPANEFGRVEERPLPQPEQKKKSTSRSRSIPKAKA